MFHLLDCLLKPTYRSVPWAGINSATALVTTASGNVYSSLSVVFLQVEKYLVHNLEEISQQQ